MSNISKIQINGILYDISDALVQPHIEDQTLHITAEERVLWNTKHIFSKTTAEWNNEFLYIPKKGDICIYSDYLITTNENGDKINSPALKIGDGITTIINLPFIVGSSQDYDELKNKPSIEGVPLSGDKTFSDLTLEEEDNASILSMFNSILK